MEKKEPSYTVVGMQTSTATMGQHVHTWRVLTDFDSMDLNTTKDKTGSKAFHNQSGFTTCILVADHSTENNPVGRLCCCC